MCVDWFFCFSSCRNEKEDNPYDACRVHGSFEVNKVAGNFHITAGKYEQHTLYFFVTNKHWQDSRFLSHWSLPTCISSLSLSWTVLSQTPHFLEQTVISLEYPKSRTGLETKKLIQFWQVGVVPSLPFWRTLKHWSIRWRFKLDWKSLQIDCKSNQRE